MDKDYKKKYLPGGKKYVPPTYNNQVEQRASQGATAYCRRERASSAPHMESGAEQPGQAQVTQQGRARHPVVHVARCGSSEPAMTMHSEEQAAFRPFFFERGNAWIPSRGKCRGFRAGESAGDSEPTFKSRLRSGLPPGARNPPASVPFLPLVPGGRKGGILLPRFLAVCNQSAPRDDSGFEPNTAWKQSRFQEPSP